MTIKKESADVGRAELGSVQVTAAERRFEPDITTLSQAPPAHSTRKSPARGPEAIPPNPPPSRSIQKVETRVPAAPDPADLVALVRAIDRRIAIPGVLRGLEGQGTDWARADAAAPHAPPTRWGATGFDAEANPTRRDRPTMTRDVSLLKTSHERDTEQPHPASTDVGMELVDEQVQVRVDRVEPEPPPRARESIEPPAHVNRLDHDERSHGRRKARPASSIRTTRATTASSKSPSTSSESVTLARAVESAALRPRASVMRVPLGTQNGCPCRTSA